MTSNATKFFLLTKCLKPSYFSQLRSASSSNSRYSRNAYCWRNNKKNSASIFREEILIRKESNNRIINSYNNSSNAQFFSTNNPALDEPNVIKSPLPDVPDNDGVTIPEMVRSLTGNWETALAFECPLTGYRLTHKQVFEHGRSFAASLIQSSALKQGDTIAIVLPNSPQYAPALYGIWDAGMIASPINPEYTPHEMQRQIQNSEAKCVITTSEFVPSIKSMPGIKSIIVVDKPQEGCHSYSEMIKTSTIGVNFLKGSEINTRETVAILPYSSGTTGLPKGVMLTHANVSTHILQLSVPNLLKANRFEHGQPQEKMIGLMPFFHCYGMTTFCIFAPTIGAHVMCLPKFNPQLFLKIVKNHKPTILHLVTPLIAFIAESPLFGKSELESVHSVVAGAAPIGNTLIRKLFDKAGKEFLFQEVYGMTELSPGATALPERFGRTKEGSCGVPMPSTYVKVVSIDGSNKSVGTKEIGELCFKGPQVMKGYWKNDEATKATIQNGWLHTGDVGYYDSDSCIYIVDRIKELIKVKGFQVAPAELEDVLRTHPDIVEAGVIGIPHSELNELPRAYIVIKPEAKNKLTEQDVMNFVKDKVAHFKQLKGGVEFVNSIPKAPTGKILRKELVKAYCDKMNIKKP